MRWQSRTYMRQCWVHEEEEKVAHDHTRAKVLRELEDRLWYGKGRAPGQDGENRAPRSTHPDDEDRRDAEAGVVDRAASGATVVGGV